MVLAEDAVHLTGRVLLKAGSELTDRHIKMFKSWGLTEAIVENTGSDGSDEDRVHDEVTNEVFQRAEKTVAELFRYTDLEFPPTAELYKICINEQIKKLAGGAGD